MSGFTRIEVHFGPENRKIVVRKGSKVRALFIGGAEAELKDPPQKELFTASMSKGITLHDNSGKTIPNELDGPSDVCYLEGNLLRCWKL